MIYYKGRDRKRMNDGHLLPLKDRAPYDDGHRGRRDDNGLL